MKALVEVIYKTLLIILFVVGLYFAYNFVDRQHLQTIASQKLLLTVPQQGLREQTASQGLAKYTEEVKQINALVINRDELVQVVSLITAAAEKQGIQVTVPIVSEQKTLITDPNAPASRTFDVRLEIAAIGDPVKLLQFIHTVEHLPYLLSLSDLAMQVTTTEGVGTLTVAGPDQTKRAPVTNGRLTAKLVVTVSQPSPSPIISPTP